ncbi:TPA: PH domain-containing protein [Elizabethkingia anophelis]|nr:PH domain-containing protein [Elizabethkingia anophelis]
MENLILKKENTMIPNEIVYEAKLHWISFCTPVILTSLGMIGLLSFTFSAGLYKLISFALTLLLYKGVIGILQLTFTRIYITEKFLIYSKGILSKNVIDISLNRIKGKKVYQSLLGRILNYGTVLITTGELTTCFVIENPNEFTGHISQYSNY